MLTWLEHFQVTALGFSQWHSPLYIQAVYSTLIVINMSFFIRVEDQVNIDSKDNTDQFNGMRFTVCMFLPMEVITVTKPVDTVAISSLTNILYKTQEEFPGMYTYVKFPFGSMDYDGLKSKNVTKVS